MKVSLQIKNNTVIWSIPFLGIYTKKVKTPIRKYICTPTFIAALLTIAQIQKQHKCLPTDEQIKKIWYTHTHTHTQWNISHRKEWILPFVITWMDLKVKFAQSRPTLCDPMENSPGWNTGEGICSLLQGIFPTRDGTRVSCIADRFFISWATRDALSQTEKDKYL